MSGFVRPKNRPDDGRERARRCRFLSALVLAATACGPSADVAAPGAGEGSAASSLPSYEMRSFESAGGECGSADQPVQCVRVALSWPEATAPAELAATVNEGIARWLRRATFVQGGSSPEEIFEELVTAHDDLRQEFPDYALPWHVERTVSIVRDDGQVFALSLYENMFTGGAHGVRTQLYRNFRPDTGAAITLEELIVEGGIEQLTAVGEEIFRTAHELAPDIALDDAGFWFDDGVFALNDNFLVSTDALFFYYNEYEVAAYAVGPTELLIPYERIGSLLRPAAGLR
jgi:hypothetical protein